MGTPIFEIYDSTGAPILLSSFKLMLPMGFYPIDYPYNGSIQIGFLNGVLGGYAYFSSNAGVESGYYDSIESVDPYVSISPEGIISWTYDQNVLNTGRGASGAIIYGTR